MKGRSIKSICILLLLGVTCVITFSFVFFVSFADIAYAEEEYNSEVDAGEPLVLFVEDLSVAKIFALDGNDLIDYALHYGSHVIAGFGYKAIEYTLNDGTTLTNYYIAVASGIITKSRGYYNIAYNTVIDDAYGISII